MYTCAYVHAAKLISRFIWRTLIGIPNHSPAATARDMVIPLLAIYISLKTIKTSAYHSILISISVIFFFFFFYLSEVPYTIATCYRYFIKCDCTNKKYEKYEKLEIFLIVNYKNKIPFPLFG